MRESGWLKIKDIPDSDFYKISFKENGKNDFTVNIYCRKKKFFGLWNTMEEVGSFSIKYRETKWRNFNTIDCYNLKDVLKLLNKIGIKNKMSTIYCSSPFYH